jgi:hypothetical protein
MTTEKKERDIEAANRELASPQERSGMRGPGRVLFGDRVEAALNRARKEGSDGGRISETERSLKNATRDRGPGLEPNRDSTR